MDPNTSGKNISRFHVEAGGSPSQETATAAQVREALKDLELTPVLDDFTIDNPDYSYANGDAWKPWTVLAGTGTTASDGTKHTLAATVAGTQTIFGRQASFDINSAALVFRIKADASLSTLRVRIYCGAGSAYLDANIGMANRDLGEMDDFVMPLAAFEFYNSPTTVDLADCRQIRFYVTPTGGNTTDLELHSIRLVHSDGIPRICFQFDDGNDNQYSTAFPILEANGFKADIATGPDYVDQAGYVTTAQLLELQAAGWGVLGHGDTTFTSLSTSEQEDEHETIQQWFRQNGFSNNPGTNHLVWPGGQRSLATDKIARLYWRTRRPVTGYLVHPAIGPHNPAWIPNYYITTSKSLSTIKDDMDHVVASGGTMLMVLHDVVTPTGKAEDITVENFTAVVEYAAQLGMQDIRYHQIFDTWQPAKVSQLK